MLTIESRRGKISLYARADDGMPRGAVFVPVLLLRGGGEHADQSGARSVRQDPGVQVLRGPRVAAAARPATRSSFGGGQLLAAAAPPDGPSIGTHRNRDMLHQRVPRTSRPATHRRRNPPASTLTDNRRQGDKHEPASPALRDHPRRPSAVAPARSSRHDRPPAAWEPTKPVEFVVPAGTGGGADQMARLHPGHRRQAQPDEAAADRRQQVGRRRRRGLPRRQGRQGRSAQDHHHAVEPVHDAARDRRAVQLEGPDAGRDAGARPVRAVGQRRDAVQDRQGVHRRGQGRRPEQVQDGRHRLEAGRPDHHRRASRRRPAPSSSTCRSRAAATWRCSSSASTSTRRSTTRSRRWRSGAPASCAPLCVFDDKRMPYKDKVTDTQSWDDIPTCKEAGRADRLHDAARHLHAGRRDARSRSTFYVDLFKKVRETPEWKEFMEKGAFNHDVHDRQASTPTGSRRPSSSTATLMKEAGFLAK